MRQLSKSQEIGIKCYARYIKKCSHLLLLVHKLRNFIKKFIKYIKDESQEKDNIHENKNKNDNVEIGWLDDFQGVNA